MEIKVKSYSSQSSLISSIIYFIIGAILFSKADEVVKFLSISVGVILGVVAVVNLVIFILTKRDVEKPTKKSSLIFSIISLVFALVFILCSEAIEQFIRFIVGAWILFTGIIRLIGALSISPKNNKFLPLLIISLLLIATGIYSIVVGNVILPTVGIIMMVYAVLEIIGYIFYAKDKAEPEVPGTTTLIVPNEPVEVTEEKTVEETKEVKEAKTKKAKEKKKKNKKDE